MAFHRLRGPLSPVCKTLSGLKLYSGFGLLWDISGESTTIAPKASHLKANHLHFPRFPRFPCPRFPSFARFPHNRAAGLLKPLFSVGEERQSAFSEYFPRFRLGLSELQNEENPTDRPYLDRF